MFEELIGKNITINVLFEGYRTYMEAIAMTSTAYSGTLKGVQNEFLILDVNDKKHYRYINKNYISSIGLNEK